VLVPTLANFMEAAKLPFQEERIGNNRKGFFAHMPLFTTAKVLALLNIFPANWWLEFSLLGPFADWGARKRRRDDWGIRRLGQDSAGLCLCQIRAFPLGLTQSMQREDERQNIMHQRARVRSQPAKQ
jgi:hypothetical protein